MIHGDFESCPSMQSRVARAVREKFPLGMDIPIPRGAIAAATSARDCPPERLWKFRHSQMGKLEQLAQDASTAQPIWNDIIPDGIMPADVELRIDALSRLIRHYGVGGQKRICQFSVGFPITGSLSHRTPTLMMESMRI